MRQLIHADRATKPEAEACPPTLAWFRNVQEILIRPEPGIALPATYLAPAKTFVKRVLAR